METFHFFRAEDGWEAYRQGVAGMVTGPHNTAHEAMEAARALYPGTCTTYVHRHEVDQPCSACERVEQAASGDSDASR